MSKNRSKETGAPTLIPLQVKTREEVRGKLKKIAAVNGLSINDVATMAIAAGLNMVEQKLSEIHQPAAAQEIAKAV